MQIISRFINKLRGNSDVNTLVKNGLSVGNDFHFGFESIIDASHCFLIRIGNHVTFAPRVHVLAHDASTKLFLGYTKIGKVVIGNNVFIGAGAIILPNVTIGDNCIIGAGTLCSAGVYIRNSVYAGNPAAYICSLDEYLEKQIALMENSPKYSADHTLGKITQKQKTQMFNELKNGIGFIR